MTTRRDPHHVYDRKSDKLEVFFGDRWPAWIIKLFGDQRPAWTIELTDNITIRIDKKAHAAVALSFSGFTELISPSGPRCFLVTGFADLPSDRRDQVLKVLHASPIDAWLDVSAVEKVSDIPFVVIHLKTPPPEIQNLVAGTAAEPAANTDELVDSLKGLAPAEFKIWKYFEDRADLFTERLWTTGTWLLGILTAILTLPFAAKFVEVDPLTVKARFPLGALALFGCFCSFFALPAIWDLKKHIESNWRSARYARTGKLKAALPFRKKTGWLILLIILLFELLAFVVLLGLAIFPGRQGIYMATEQNKLLVRRYYEQVVNTGNVDEIASFIAPDYVEVHDNVRHAIGLEGAREHVLGVRRVYADLHLTVEQQIAEGEWVVTRVTMRGTHQGTWLGIAPTGKAVEVTAVNVDKVVDGRIVEHGGAANLLEPLLRIGAVQVVGRGDG